jgi:DNA replication protein DnaC
MYPDTTEMFSECPSCRKPKAIDRVKSCIKIQIGERYTDANIDDFNHLKGGVDGLKKFLDARFTSKNNFYIFGDRGAGKTHLAAAIQRYYAGKYFSQYQIGRIYVSGKAYFNHIAFEYGSMDAAITAPILVIDEFVFAGDKEVETLFQLIDERYSARRLTIGMSNFTNGQIERGESELGSHYGPLIISRLTREETQSVIVLPKRVRK